METRRLFLHLKKEENERNHDKDREELVHGTHLSEGRVPQLGRPQGLVGDSESYVLPSLTY